MKPFANRYYRLRDARVEVRLVYTGFLLFVVVGMATMAAFQLHHIGPWPADVAAYYRGGERAGQMTFAKTFRELVEVTHFHTFIMGTVYLIVAHLFLATGISARVQRLAILVSFAGLFGDILSPWLICYVSAGFAYLEVASWLAEWIGLATLMIVPIAEMWFVGVPDELSIG